MHHYGDPSYLSDVDLETSRRGRLDIDVARSTSRRRNRDNDVATSTSRRRFAVASSSFASEAVAAAAVGLLATFSSANSESTPKNLFL